MCVQELKPPKSWCPDLLFFADNCKKLGLVFDDVVGIVEIINSRDVKVQDPSQKRLTTVTTKQKRMLREVLTLNQEKLKLHITTL